MPVSVLIPPDNRLLGWSLSDLTLYGAPNAANVAIGRATDDTGLSAPAATPAVSGSASSPGPSESNRAAEETTALLDRDAGLSPVPSSTAFSAPIDHAAVHGVEPAPSVPSPIGSGSFLQAPVVTPLQAATGDHATGGDAALPADGVTQPLTHVLDLSAGLSHDLPGGLVPASLGDAVAAGLSHVANAVVDGPVATLDPGATIDTIVADLGTDIIPAGADIVGLAATTLDSSLSAFGGSDPAAGVQTLIGMMDSGEAFDLGHLTAPDTDLAGGASIIDALAADEAAPTLLGHDADAAHHSLDDHGVHLGI